MQTLWKWLNRRSQRRRFTWQGFDDSARTFPSASATDHRQATSSISAACVLLLMPETEASISEEPGAGKRHAGICAGAVGQLAVLPR